ncbi:MAG: tripartite tricarboxylate transporter permease [Candidatus Brocadiia bacterium]
MLPPIIESAVEGLLLVFSWPNILYPVVGTLLTMGFAFMPGLGGTTLMALLIPLTFNWEPLPTVLLFGALMGGSTFMGSVTAILFNVPGATPNAATMLDGHPMARQGHARTAIGSAATSSALGSTFGILVLVLTMPLLRRAILAFGPAEFVMLAVWGLTTVAVVSRGSTLKGLAAGGLGLVMATVGADARTAELRYTFGSLYLVDGLSLIPVAVGLFALAETIDLMVTGRRTISGKTRLEELGGSLREGVRESLRNVGLLLRCSVIGTLIGIIPGTGGTVASFVAYGHAARSGRGEGPEFGEGNVRGVIAPEAANDAKDGGSLLPTLAFGIPGSTGTALLLVALTVHGLVPGRQLVTDNLSLVFALIWSLFLANWITSLLGVAAVNPLARLTVLRTRLLVPVILMLASAGACAYRGRVADIYLAFACGIVGYLMKKHDWPRIPVIIALVLGPLFEANFHITLRLHRLGRVSFWHRPIAMLLLALTVFSLLAPLWRRWLGRMLREEG